MDKPHETVPADPAAVGPVALLLAKFSNAVDHKKAEAIADLFTPDGVFQPVDRPGRPAIAAFFASRFAAEGHRRTRHTWSNIVVRPLSADRADFEAVLTNYAFDPGVSQEQIEVRVGNVWGVCRGKSPDAWRFESHFHERVYAAVMPLLASTPPLAG
jgi:uncharacterized protein (TIGR02246 family)